MPNLRHFGAIFGGLLVLGLAGPSSAEPKAGHGKSPPTPAAHKAAPGKEQGSLGKAVAAGAVSKPRTSPDKGKGSTTNRAGDKDPGKGTPGAEPEAAADAPGDGAGRAGPRGRGTGFRNGVRELRDKYSSGAVPKKKLAAELKQLANSRNERRQQHRAALKDRWGNRLAMPDALQELRHHERRMAHLNRMLLLASTERTGAKREKLTQRIEKLMQRENERHERKMSSLEAPGAARQPADTLAAAADGKSAAPTPPKGAEPSEQKGAKP